MSKTAEGIRWDLSDLFASHEDPRIEATLQDCRNRAEAFASRFRGAIYRPQGPAPESLLEGLRELEGIEDTLSRVSTYAGLLYAADSLRAEFQDLEQRVEQRATEVRNLLLFFELEWLDLDDSVAVRLIHHPTLKNYSHYLKNLRRFRPHKLSEPEEKIVNEKDNTGRNAFGRLFSEITAALTFALDRDGKPAELTLSEILALMHHPDRQLRQRAWESLFEGLSHHEHALGFIYDTMIQDHLTMDRLRHYPNPMMERHLGNEIDGEAVARMMEVTEANYRIGHDYFRLKARLLGLPRLALYDQYAPVGKEFTPFSLSRAQEVILEAFGAFSPVFRSIAAEFFAKHWIDAEVRKGKRGGAFCASPSPQLHPYILCNYTDTMRDVMTVAHELGHGLHGCLSREQSFLNYDTPLTTAETASVFGEMLVFDYLVEHEPNPRVKLGLVAGKIEDAFATVFRQNVLTRFEQAVFARRSQGRLTPATIGVLWFEANEKYYGDAVEMGPAYRWGWSYIPHFIHTRFYCYSYVFGELLVLSLYRMYREQGENFVPRYLALLVAGGSDSPEALLGPLGVDFHDPNFWQKGFDEIRSMVKRAQQLADQIGKD
ncbi:MAG: M3 family oligoendopeptidase [Deltaproteobacteria bacterium]|nr:M3 family oligoendopeptidase [Deltaproteobacteria bacterium]